MVQEWDLSSGMQLSAIMPHPPGCQPSNLVLLSRHSPPPGRAFIPYLRSGDALGLKKWCHLVCIQLSFVLGRSFVFEETAFEVWYSPSRKTDSCSGYKINSGQTDLDAQPSLATYLMVTVHEALLLASPGLLVRQVG